MQSQIESGRPRNEASPLEDIRRDFLYRVLFEKPAIFAGLTIRLNSGLQQLQDWVEQFARDEKRNEVSELIVSIRANKTRDPEKDFRKLLTESLGFALMKVDPLYQHIYYKAIIHPLLRDNDNAFIARNVYVPFHQGSVGFAAHVGALSLNDSFEDPRGAVALEDLVQGNISIMMVGLGVQDLPTEDAEIQPPRTRWVFRDQWVDTLADSVSPSISCVAVASCFFPARNLFEEFGTPFKPTRELSANSPYELFQDVCRVHEHGILRDLSADHDNFIVDETNHGVSRGDQTNTLDLLASQQTKGNPTGGLFAIRTDERDVAVCAPQLEARLASKLKMSSREGTVFGAADDPLVGHFSQHCQDCELGHDSEGKPCLRIRLHYEREHEPLTPDWKNLDYIMPRFAEFFSTVRKDCFEKLQGVYSTGENRTLEFEDVKIAVDAFEDIARSIANAVAKGPADAERQRLKEDVERLMNLSLRRIGSGLACDKTRCFNELDSLIEHTGSIRNRLLSATAYYWAPHHRTPYNPDKPIVSNEPHQEIDRLNDAWRENYGGFRRTFRRLCLRAFLAPGERIHLTEPINDSKNEYRYLVAMPGDFISSASLTLRFDPDKSTKTPPTCLAFILEDAAQPIGNTLWINSGKHRIAGVAIRKDNFEVWLKQSIAWEQTQSDHMIRSLSTTLGARPAPEIDGWPVRFYTSGGRWTQRGRDLAWRLKEYEDTVQRRTEAIASQYAKGAAHGFKNALLLPPVFLEPATKLISQLESRDRTMTEYDVLGKLAGVKQDLYVTSALLTHLQNQAQLFFWVMSPEKFVQGNEEDRQQRRWPQAPIEVVSARALLLGLAVVFNTTLALQGKLDETTLMALSRGMAKNAVLFDKQEMTHTATMQFFRTVERQVKSIRDFSLSVRFDKSAWGTRSIGGVQRAAFEGILIELVQNAVRVALAHPKEGWVNAEIAHSAAGDISVSLCNSSTRKDAGELLKIVERVQRDDDLSGAVRGLSQVSALVQRIECPFDIEWPSPAQDAECVEVCWRIRFRSESRV